MGKTLSKKNPPSPGSLTPELISPNPHFVGRHDEIELIQKVQKLNSASILTVFGRRRAGKTELIEQTLRTRSLLKFEGLEHGSPAVQRRNFLTDLARYLNNPLMAKLKLNTWREVFELLAEQVKAGRWTIYFEELQWMANYHDDLIAELKLVWDNRFKRNPNLLIVLCGSSPSFMIKKVIKSKALYNRSQYQIHLHEFTIQDAKLFLAKRSLSSFELMDIYLSVGGLPEYLNYLKPYASGYLGLCSESFKKNGFFVSEYDRVLVSSLGKQDIYENILKYLAQKKSATREEILNKLNLKSGGTASRVLLDLELCGFIGRFTPVDAKATSTLVKYQITDSYLQFYFKFIAPQSTEINRGKFDKNPTQALSMTAYRQWLGLAFERWCRQNAHLIAERLGFAAVEYSSGPYFKKGTTKKGNTSEGVQIDLMFIRKDRNLTICEIKYTDTPTDSTVIPEFERKLALVDLGKRYSITRVLISAYGADQKLRDRMYFDRILNLEDLIGR